MRNITLLIVAILLLAGCSNDNTPSSAPTFALHTEGIDVTDEGGYFEVEYTISGLNNSIMPIARCDAEWITDIDNSTNGIIALRILANYTPQPRTATITLKHIGTDVTPTLTIRQEGCTGEKLAIELVECDYSKCSIRLTPQNDDMPYIVMMAEKSYFEASDITNPEALIAADIARYYSYIESRESLEEFIERENIALRGVQTRQWQDLSPAKEYVIYAYGIYVNGDTYDRITPIYHTIVAERMPQRVPQNFDVEISTTGPEVTLTIEPQSWEGYYMVQFVEDSQAGYIEQGLPLDNSFESAVAESFFYISDHLFYFEEKSAEQIMQQLGYRGRVTLNQTLNANHRYMALTYAIASDDGNVPMVVSKPIVSYFTTGSVERSDMTFTAMFENIRPRSVDVTITPSCDEPYTAVLMYAKSLPAGDKEEQLQWVMEKYAPLELTGIYSEHISQLPPATEFVLAVYGYYAGAATTDLFLYRFTTLEDGEGTNYVTEARTTAYDLAEVVTLEPYYSAFMGYADYFMSIEIETATPSPSLHFDIFRSDVVEEYSEAEIRESLLDYAYTSSPDWALCTYGNEYVVCALAEDERGYVGELFISEPIRFERGDVLDAAIFVELYSDYVTRNGLRQSNF